MIEIKYILYICGTDIEHLEGDPRGVTFYTSLDDLKNAKDCLDLCGVATIEIDYDDFKHVKVEESL